MYVAGLKLGLTPEGLAAMSWPTLANMLDSSLPPAQEEEEEVVADATQEDFDCL